MLLQKREYRDLWLDIIPRTDSALNWQNLLRNKPVVT